MHKAEIDHYTHKKGIEYIKEQVSNIFLKSVKKIFFLNAHLSSSKNLRKKE